MTVKTDSNTKRHKVCVTCGVLSAAFAAALGYEYFGGFLAVVTNLTWVWGIDFA